MTAYTEAYTYYLLSYFNIVVQASSKHGVFEIKLHPPTEVISAL